jgi:hypothetical protein
MLREFPGNAPGAFRARPRAAPEWQK